MVMLSILRKLSGDGLLLIRIRSISCSYFSLSFDAAEELVYIVLRLGIESPFRLGLRKA